MSAGKSLQRGGVKLKSSDHVLTVVLTLVLVLEVAFPLRLLHVLGPEEFFP